MAGKRLVLHVLLSLAMFAPHDAVGEDPITIFVFGDSTMDVGNNNLLPRSKAKANFPYNGIDFHRHKATGRFSNGYNTADFLAQLFGLRMSPPPFLTLEKRGFVSRIGKHISNGTNFASAGSGILNFTGVLPWREVIPLKKQTHEHFVAVHSNLTEKFGSKASSHFFCKSLFVISVGSNDIFEYHYLNVTREGVDDFITHLMEEYEDNLRLLYELGAKKFGIISAPPLGCCPYARSFNKNQTCTDELNAYALKFHHALGELLQRLSSQLKGMQYSLGNTFKMVTDILAPSSRFKEKEAACCGGGVINGVDPCTPKANLCKDRQGYLFWDRYHPSSNASELAAQALYNGTIDYVAPINFMQLVSEKS